MSASSFPGGTSVSGLDVYTDSAGDGVCGGSPHVHLISTEAYVVVGGRGALQTLTLDGFEERSLEPGDVVWFTPGTVHRAVNHGDLKVIVVMSNAGLPEAGDAVMTFPAGIVGDAEAYAEAATLPAIPGASASARRDLAVEGFTVLKEALERGDSGPLEAFYAAAGALVQTKAEAWDSLVVNGPLAQALISREHTAGVLRGDVSHLAKARVQQAVSPAGERAYGMCGRLQKYDVSDQE